MEKLSFKLPVFEGPLDLLLHLISKHKLNIYDIPITELVEQYLLYIEQVREQDMDLASEFLEMAARLVYLKTVSLLPVHEEAEELKRELTGELLEYRDCKIMAGKLAQQAKGGDYLLRKPMELPKDLSYKRQHQPEELLNAYISALGKGRRRLPPPVTAFSGIVTHKIVSVGSKIIFVLRRLWKRGQVPFQDLFQSAPTRSDMVATFLAVLELVKGKRVTVDETDGEPSIILHKGEQ